MTRFCFTFALVVSLGTASALADDAGTLAGTWKFLSVHAGGAKVPDEITRTLELKVTKDGLEMSGQALKESIKSKFSLDEKAKSIDLEPLSGPEKGKVSKGLYELKMTKEGGTEKVKLVLYFAKPGEDRPKKLEMKAAEGHFLWELEKTK